MSLKVKKAIIVAIAAFLSAVTGYNVAPTALESLCIKLSFCEAPAE